MCFYYDDVCSVWRQTIHVARKPHPCESCRRQIEPGEQYLSVFSIFEGDADTRCLCNQCAQDWRQIHLAEVRAGCAPEWGVSTWCPMEEIHGLMRYGNRDGWHSEFDGDKEGGHVLFWPYGVPPAARSVDLKQFEELTR